MYQVQCTTHAQISHKTLNACALFANTTEVPHEYFLKKIKYNFLYLYCSDSKWCQRFKFSDIKLRNYLFNKFFKSGNPFMRSLV